MNIAVDDFELGFGAALELLCFNVHGASSIGAPAISSYDLILAVFTRSRQRAIPGDSAIPAPVKFWSSGTIDLLLSTLPGPRTLSVTFLTDGADF
jgi:hypothetical protein